MTLGSLHSWKEETWWCDEAERERQPLIKAPSFALKAPEVYHMNIIIMCLLHLYHFQRPFTLAAYTCARACVRVGQFWAEFMSMRGFNLRRIIIPWLLLRATTTQSPSARTRSRTKIKSSIQPVKHLSVREPTFNNYSNNLEFESGHENKLKKVQKKNTFT